MTFVGMIDDPADPDFVALKAHEVAEVQAAQRRVTAKRALRRIIANPEPVAKALAAAGLIQEASAILDLGEVFRNGGVR